MQIVLINYLSTRLRHFLEGKRTWLGVYVCVCAAPIVTVIAGSRSHFWFLRPSVCIFPRMVPTVSAITIHLLITVMCIFAHSTRKRPREINTWSLKHPSTRRCTESRLGGWHLTGPDCPSAMSLSSSLLGLRQCGVSVSAATGAA